MTVDRLSWPARVGYGLVAALLIVAGFFFLTVALAAGAIVAMFILARLWWVSRSGRHASQHTDIEGEFTVVDRRPPISEIDRAAPERQR
jgi:membrane protein implicated in regulation of membrane protease activity